jgi:hypothetical protein
MSKASDKERMMCFGGRWQPSRSRTRINLRRNAQQPLTGSEKRERIIVHGFGALASIQLEAPFLADEPKDGPPP